MVEFLTLFLGLVSGIQTIEVSVTEDVAAVELMLDGEVVAEIDGEPWQAEVNLGADLKPRILGAIARNTDGIELHRTEQTINTAQSRAFLRIVLGRTQPDGTRDGRLVWVSAENAKPIRVAVTLDAEPLEVVANRAFKLPFGELDPTQTHIINAQADFPDDSVATATVLLGGRFADKVVSQLTAVPVVLSPGANLPGMERMSGWLKKGDQPLEIVAVEERSAEVIVVRDRNSYNRLIDLAYRFREARHRAVGTLGSNRSVRLLKATPVRDAESADQSILFDRFPLSEALSEGYGGVPYILGSRFFRDRFSAGGADGHGKRSRLEQPQRLADAVANAGVSASASGFLRAVVLVLGENPEDGSQWSASTVRRFLTTMGVPFYVWSTLSESRQATVGAPEGWEPIQDISTHPQYLEAVGRLSKDLGEQRVLWVSGEHFLHDIQLASHAEGVRMVQ